MLLGALVLFAFFAIRKGSFKLTPRQFISVAVVGFFSIYITNILEFWGLSHISAAKTCFIYSLSPFFTALFSYIHFKEKINSPKAIGFAISFLGFIPVLYMQTGSEGIMKAFSVVSWPDLAVMGAALCAVYGWVLLRIVLKKDEMAPLKVSSYSMLIGGLMALTHSLFVDSWSPTPILAGSTSEFFKWTLLITLISNVICFNFYGHLLKRFTATFLSFVGLLSPIFASMSEWFLIGTPPSWVLLASSTVVASGLYLVYRAELKQGYIKSNNEEQPVSTS